MGINLIEERDELRFSEFSRPVKILYYVTFWAFGALVVGMTVWVVMSSLKSSAAIFDHPFRVPNTPAWANFTEAWKVGDFGALYLNSIGITVASVVGLMVFEGLAGYAFARFDFRFKNTLFWVFIVGQLVPAQMVVLPSFLEIAHFGLANTRLGLVLQYWSWAPFAVLFFRASFLAIPREIEEAAVLDGAGRLVQFVRIVIPMSKGALGAVGAIYGMWIWENLLFPISYLRSPGLFTVPLGLAAFEGAYTTYWGPLIAAVIIVTVPPLLLFLALRKTMESGFAEGALNV